MIVTTKLKNRFLAKIIHTENGCWQWTGGISRGYGKFWVDGGLHQAHVVSWVIYRGTIPSGKKVLHNCPSGDNRACCNPDHLWLGTQQENIIDMVNKGRHGLQRRKQLSKTP